MRCDAWRSRQKQQQQAVFQLLRSNHSAHVAAFATNPSSLLPSTSAALLLSSCVPLTRSLLAPTTAALALQ